MRDLSHGYWDDRQNPVYGLDSRVKLLLAIAAIVSLALVSRPSWPQLTLYLAALCVVIAIAHMPLLRILKRSLLVVPFVGFFSFILYVTGDAQRAWFILSKSYLSALTVMVLAACTPMPKVAAAARFFRAPGLLIEVMQLIYRYLFVLSAEARAMQIAFSARGGRRGKVGMRAASGMISVLFARSYGKASMVYRAMESRGFSGQLVSPPLPRITPAELAIAILGISFAAALHLV